MNAILCCAPSVLLQRWHSALKDISTVYQTTALQDLSTLAQQRITFDLLLVHRSLVDAKVITHIRERAPNCRLFILSDRPEDEEGLLFLRLGVVGYANSYISAERLREAARTVAGGAVWVSQQLMQRLISGVVADKPSATTETAPPGEKTSPLLAALSNREYQIANLVAEGLSNLEIAAQLGITERTVKAHLGTIYAKTSTKGRLGLALLINLPNRGTGIS